jgi:hypothetical protein
MAKEVALLQIQVEKAEKEDKKLDLSIRKKELAIQQLLKRPLILLIKQPD